MKQHYEEKNAMQTNHSNDGNRSRTERECFGETHWTVVLMAAKSESPEAEAAMAILCHDYRDPLCAYLRWHGRKPEEAEDLTQGFFADRVLKQGFFKGLSPKNGKFRSWLLTCLQHYVADEYNERMTEKAGGKNPHDSVDDQMLPDPTPESLYEYDHAWAVTLLNRALNQLCEEYTQDGKAAEFDVLERFLPGARKTPTCAEAAILLGKTEEAVKMAVSRVRTSLRELLRKELRRTVSSEKEVEEEWRYLYGVLLSCEDWGARPPRAQRAAPSRPA